MNMIQITYILSNYENNLKKSGKPIYHIEAYCISILNVFNS